MGHRSSAVLAPYVIRTRRPGPKKLRRSALAKLRPLIAALVLMVPSAAVAQDVHGKASYILTLGGLNIASMDVTLEDTDSRYTLDLAANVTGMGAVVASGTAKASSSGPSTANSLTSQKFTLQTRANGETFSVNVDFAGRDVSAFKVEPPIVDNYERVPLERRHLTGVSDFLSACLI